MTTPLFYARNPNQFLYVYALTSAYRAGYRVYDPDFALSRDPDIWEKIRRDPVIQHALELRLHMIAGREWHVEPASDKPVDKKASAVMEELLKNIENFLVSRYNLAQAVVTGRTYSYVCGDRKAMSVDEGPVLNWWRPCRLQDVDRRRFFFEPVWRNRTANETGIKPHEIGDRALRLRNKIWSVARGQWEGWTNPEYFVKLVYADAESRLGYGRGLMEAIYYYYYVKTTILREGVQGVERWAQGMLTAKIDGLREASADRNNEAVQQSWLDVLNMMRSRHVAVFDKQDEINVVNHTGTGHQMVTDFLNYLDQAMTRLILGSVLPSGGGGDQGGSFARAQVESNTMEALIQYDRQLLDEAISRDLIGLVWRLNGPQLASVGLGDAKQPRYRTVQEDQQNPEKNAQVATLLLHAGIPLRRDEVYRRTGWTPPSEDDEVITMPVGGGAGKEVSLPSLSTIKEGG